jgi:REP element-mobilizing transposase RayT
MPRRELLANTFYHVYNKSFSQESIFIRPKDFEKFFEKIKLLLEKYNNIKILSYCILPNHFHFLMREVSEKDNPGIEMKLIPGSNISRFMNALLGSYAKYFNMKYDKRGMVFQGRFGAREVIDEVYLATLKDYIEFNPVKHGIVDNPEEWNYSSFSPNPIPGSNLNLDFEKFDPYFE